IDARPCARTIARCDGERIGRAITEIALNALHATPADGTVTMTLESRAGEAVITIADTGPGVDPAVLPHVLDYKWLATRRSRESAGLGLGVARAVVEAHGGRLALVSRPREGTTVTIAFPLVVRAARDLNAATP